MSSKPKPWHERIQEAISQGHFTLEDKRLAQNWTTCAVGENRGRYTETESEYRPGMPADQALWELGVEFNDIVLYGTPNYARQVWARIQDRITELQKEAQP